MSLHSGKLNKYRIFSDGVAWHVHGPSVWCGGYDTWEDAIEVYNCLTGA